MINLIRFLNVRSHKLTRSASYSLTSNNFLIPYSMIMIHRRLVSKNSKTQNVINRISNWNIPYLIDKAFVGPKRGPTDGAKQETETTFVQTIFKK